MDTRPIRIAAINRGLSHKQLAHRAGINPRRWYRLIEGLAVPSEEELARIAAVTGLSVAEVRGALPASAGGRDAAAV